MFLSKRAQSTAEYAITLGLVVAVAAGFLSVALKGGIRDKSTQSLNFLQQAGGKEDKANDSDFDLSSYSTSGSDQSLYTQDLRKTTVDDKTFVDKSILHKGGKEDREQSQTTTTSAVSIETLDAAE
ncbi:MAG: hypothetical protein HY761_06780 [Candidatus Omnitrophica bacterium]|nr:hypothetical protein [Candidatus Omnitrophota bacterium]